MSTADAAPVLKGPHARRRFTQLLAKVDVILLDASAIVHDALPGQVVFQSNGRTPVFMLEALGRVYDKLDLDAKLFERIRLETKIVEDALGAVDFWAVLRKKAVGWSLPAGVKQLCDQWYFDACGRAWAWIKSQNWITSRYHPEAELLSDKFRRKLKGIEWHARHKEAKALRKWLSKELLNTHEKVQELDLTQIEAGLHKARREIRWPSIYFTAVEGGFVLDRDASPPANWDRYMAKSIVDSPFNNWNAPEADDVPIHVPAPLQYALSYAIDQLGVIKDKAQWTETVEHLLHLSGEKADVRALMGESYLAASDATDQGRAVLEQVLQKDQVLLRLSEGLRI